MNIKNMNAIWSVGFLQGQFEATKEGFSPERLLEHTELEDALNFLADKIKQSVKGGNEGGLSKEKTS